MIVWEMNAAGTYIYLNPGARESLDSIETLSLDDWLSVIHADDVKHVRAVLENARAQGTEYQVEYRVIKSDGTTRWMVSSGAPRLTGQGQVEGYVGAVIDVSDRQTPRLRNFSKYDPLTGLPTRTAVLERLRLRLNDPRGEMAQAVMFLDLDRFKAINEGLGMEFGDVVLQEVAKRLAATVRENDLVARLGGNEFIIIAECRNGRTSASRVASKVLQALSQPMLVRGREIGITASMGISLFPQDGDSCEVLLKCANTALYSAKLSRESGLHLRFYDAEMSLQSQSRMLLLSALRQALDNGEFKIHYQPRVDLRTMEIAGMEALLRWNHPELGAVSPASFVPLAEEAGLIEQIGAWVLREATRQAKTWSELHKRPFRVSVNVSARQLQSRRLLETVEDALRASGLDADQLELELTETALMTDTELAVGVLSELRKLGVHLAVDDFGTGYSSLSYLSLFPLDCLKLDRSFLKQRSPTINPEQLATAIINLAHSLNLTVVAEGVETEEHLSFLRSTACDEIQGYCISVPLAPSAFEAFVEKRQTSLRIPESQMLRPRVSH